MLKRLTLIASFAAMPAIAQTPVVPASQTVALDRIVAVVGDQPITRFDVQERILQKQQMGMRAPTDERGMHELEKQIVEEMIDEELLLMKARELKIEIPENDLNSSVDKQLREVRSKFANEAEFRRELAKAGLGTPEEYKRYLIDQLRRTEMIRQAISKLKQEGKVVPANISEADVREAFERNRAQLPAKPASVTFRQVVINPKPSPAAKAAAKAKADTLLSEIKKGADFELVAKRESMDDSTKALGGDLGWQRMGLYVMEFDRWLFGPYALRPGDLSPVVETPFGYHIIRVDRVRPGEVKARHILIKPVVDSAQVRLARLQADTVLGQWRAGAPFDSLAKKYHDYANKEETSLLNPFPRDSLPPSYMTAFAGKKPNDIVTFDIPGASAAVPKLVVAQLLTVDEGGARTLDEMRDMVRSRLAEEGGMRRLLDNLRRENFVSVKLEAPAGKP
jgi:peptidyl-prolyl cis-trans isomerase SurA